MSDKILSKIAALLRKAESTDNEHEADACMQAAQRLATLASIDLAVARSHSAEQQKRSVPVQTEIMIGESGKRGLRTFVQLFLAISTANNVKCDIARDSSRVFAYGFESDIETAQALYASLVVQMVRSSDSYIKSGMHAQEVVTRRVRDPRATRVNRWGETEYSYIYEDRPVHATTARINFQEAFAARIGARLKEVKQRAENEAQREPAASGSPSSVEIVLRARDLELLDHYKANSHARGHWGGYRATAGDSELSRRAGDRAGRTARLGGERAIGGSRAEIGA